VQSLSEEDNESGDIDTPVEEALNFEELNEKVSELENDIKLIKKANNPRAIDRLTSEVILMSIMMLIIGFAFIWSMVTQGLTAATASLGALGSFTALITFWFKEKLDTKKAKDEVNESG